MFVTNYFLLRPPCGRKKIMMKGEWHKNYYDEDEHNDDRLKRTTSFNVRSSLDHKYKEI